MFRTLSQTWLIVLTVLCGITTVALAAPGTVSGTIQNVDPDQGRITVRTGREHVIELRAPSELLIGLQNGDVVEVTKSGQQATFIQRQRDQRQQLGVSGTLKFQPPEAPFEAPQSSPGGVLP
ncbi:MAG: hypothetical protein AB7N91_18280 [Candidatus Tectimicrobiota bacterium]